MQMLATAIEEPWAFGTRPDAEAYGKKYGNGNAYRYFATKEAAEKAVRWHQAKGRYHGPIEYRPGESRIVGYA